MGVVRCPEQMAGPRNSRNWFFLDLWRRWRVATRVGSVDLVADCFHAEGIGRPCWHIKPQAHVGE